jgi:hypothetical protein
MTTRWATPDGVTVDTVILRETPPQKRSRDPRCHPDPRHYFVVGYGSRNREFVGGYPRTDKRWEEKSLADLQALAERDGWDTGKLTQLPTYVVADALPGHGGHVISHGSDGVPFDLEAAAKFAAKRNEGLKDDYRHAHRVYALTPVDDAAVAAAAAPAEEEAA